MLKSLATQEDIADIIHLYEECFNTPSCDPSQLEDQHPTVSFDFGRLHEEADPGVEVESTLSPSLIANKLGFYDGIPLLFNSHRHKDGLTPWDDPCAFENTETLKTSGEFTPINPRWHQLAGVHAVLRRLFSTTATSETSGVLIADEVGLGKTLQSLAIVATLAEYFGRQSLAFISKHNGQTAANPPLLRT
jgi:TATA-binding protein-associated factor